MAEIGNIIHFSKKGDAREVGQLPRTRREYKQMRIQDAHLYRERCLQGEPHPLNIEAYNYELVIVEEAYIDNIHTNISGPVTDEIQWFIESVSSREHVMWAIDNSFDGLYVSPRPDPASFKTKIVFAVYLKDELATFWNLKYGR